MPQAAIADGERVAAQLGEDRPHDARAGEDDLGAVGLQPDDPAALLGGARRGSSSI